MEKIGECKWLIEKEGGMRVPGMIIASSELMEEIRNDNSINQVRNVAYLPGIQLYSLAMPDIHWGYGFPIGGVAAMDIEEGVISPGGVGYDINCLPGDAEILTPLGFRKKIKRISIGDEVTVLNDMVARPTEVILTLDREEPILYTIKTRAGFKLSLSPEHPILTRKGMKDTRELSRGEKVAIHPFKGMEYERPEEFEVISEDIFRETIKKELKNRGLLPLTSRNEKLPYLLKIFGYLLGDGTVYNKNSIFYGERKDLEEIKEDLRFLGYSGAIYERDRTYNINGYKFSRKETSLKVSARSLVELLRALGYPRGNKTTSDVQIPSWMVELPIWMKRLFLASYFGAEMSKPKTPNGYNFYMPEVKFSRKKGNEEVGYKFLSNLQKMLEEFGISSNISIARETKDRIHYRILVHGNPKNLLTLWEKIGYEYNRKRRSLAMAAIVYLRLKQAVIHKRELLRKKIRNEQGKRPRREIFEEYQGQINKRFIERSLYGQTEKARPPAGFIKFEEFFDEFSEGEIVYDEVVDIQKTVHNDRVYDFTIKNNHHNFVANGFVVSNCGVRVVRTSIHSDDIKERIEDLTNKIYSLVPCGVGSTSNVKLSQSELKTVLKDGASWAVRNGFGWDSDIEYTEENGKIEGADPDVLSDRAIQRGRPQLGTLGAGNHFIEIQKVVEIYDKEAARVMGLEEGLVTVMIHTGSRGLGHQVCSDWVKSLMKVQNKFNFDLPDKELISAPIQSKEGQGYLCAMRAAANFAWTNRQIILSRVRDAFALLFGQSAESLQMNLIYDVAHNIAKIETHTVNGVKKKLCVHRKGATRAFPPDHPDIPSRYKSIGQPVLIPGDMGTASYILVGTESAMEETFGSTCHGAGRRLSRKKAMKITGGRFIRDELAKKGIYIRAHSIKTIREEVPEAYKDIDMVVDTVSSIGISKKVARMAPMAVIKG
ncbi:RtcB family protein [candidate division WOR-3 bacterium]|nr:RtcB family protein [candidate division WOR-3 bacterium]